MSSLRRKSLRHDGIRHNLAREHRSVSGRTFRTLIPDRERTFSRSTPEDPADFAADRLLEHVAHLFDREGPNKFHFYIPQ